MSLSKTMLIGNLGRDPEIHTFPSGDKVAKLSVATSESWRDRETGERKEKTEWHRVVVYGKAAEFVEKYLKTGARVYVEGRNETRSYGEDDAKKYTTEVVVRAFGGRIESLEGRKSDGEDGEGPAEPAGRKTKPAGGPVDDEIPF